MSDPFRDIEAAEASKPAPLVEYWGKEIDLAWQRGKTFRKQADKCVKLYEIDAPKENSFNILYSNTETLLPSIYNTSPRPIVDRRFHDADPTAKHAAEALERTLSYLLDSNSSEYEKYHALFRQAVLMALVPGQGVTWFKYDPQIMDPPPSKDDDGDPDQEVTGEVLPATSGKVMWETVCGQDVNYDEFLHGYSRRWVGVPWVARKHAMTKEDCTENFGKALAEKLNYLRGARRDDTETKAKKDDSEEHNQGSALTVEVWEIWNKTRREVVFYAPTYKDALLKVVADPLKLPGFFPCPRPLHFMKRITTLIPVPPYMAYEAQATELNRVSLRITRVINAMKVRGFYDGTIQGLQELLSKDDNTLIPAKNVASMQNGQNLQNSIWLMPLGELITVLNELFASQNQIKATIYELTGISDIMRGDTKASETKGAQVLKDKWGTLRLQNMQGATQHYIREALRIVAALAGKHFGVETFAAMTSLDFATPAQVQQAQQMQQAAQQQALMLQQQQAQAAAMQQPQAPGVMPSGAPAGPPPAPSPQMQQVQQAMQQAQLTLAKTKWADVIALLRDDQERQYRIDIETNSTLADTTAEDQQNIVQAMTALTNTAESFGPLVQEGVLPMSAMKELMLSITRRFEFGRRVEDQIQAIPDQIPPKEDPKAKAVADKLATDQQKLMQDQMKLQQEQLTAMQEKMQVQQAAAQQVGEMKQDMASREAEIKMREQALAQKEAEVSEQIATGQKKLEDTVVAAQERAEIEGLKRELKLEQRISKAEQANRQRNQETMMGVKELIAGQAIANQQAAAATDMKNQKTELSVDKKNAAADAKSDKD